MRNDTMACGRFFLAVATLVVLLPTFALGDDDATAKIKEFEAQLALKNGEFDWALHNELRHYYGAVDRDQEFHHINVILANMLMNDYMLNILSDWEIGKNRSKAIANLRRVATTKKQFPIVAAACWLKVGELESTGPNSAPNEARSCFQNVLDLKGDDLEPYHHLAKTRLEDLGMKDMKDDQISSPSKY